ncbi:hypothetical protein [Leptospira stimsonii]|uniref:Uncharacterized protein n=1 Tax=Leptospira stimsonii TaxID=2202203 RepID=A0A8B3CKS0_9LEPT|nr:hypothetical protein [Leptospira stimsonii]RHX83854.1 hypothetical protein DLM78_20430 [Leptospira stimsonii]
MNKEDDFNEHVRVIKGELDFKKKIQNGIVKILSDTNETVLGLMTDMINLGTTKSGKLNFRVHLKTIESIPYEIDLDRIKQVMDVSTEEIEAFKQAAII